MTRRQFHTVEENLTIVAGWDRPLQHYFLGITAPCATCAGTGLKNGVQLVAIGADPADHERDELCQTCVGDGRLTAFDNLEDPRYRPFGAMTLRNVRMELENRGIPLPERFFVTLLDDFLNDRGNEFRDFGTIEAPDLNLGTPTAHAQ